MAGHPAGDRVDCVADLDSARFEQVGELPHVVLGLRDGHSVTGHEDDLVRVGEHHGDVVGGGRANGAAVGVGCSRSGAWGDLAEGAEEHVRDRTVHRPSHHQREQRARRADEHSADDQDVVLELEAGRGRGESRKRIQQRDHDRHVRAADRQHEEDSEQGRGADHRHQHPETHVDHRPRAETDRSREHDRIDELRAGIRDRPAGDELLQLREGDERAGERDRADQGRKLRGDAPLDADVADVRPHAVELDDRDERRRTAAHAVEQRHHLRHRRHLDLACGDRSEGAADRHSDDDLPVADDLGLSERDRDRDQHADGADLVAAARGGG